MEKVRLGFIGVGNRGSQLLQWSMENTKAEIVALCDVYQPYLERDHGKIDPRLLEKRNVPKLNEKLPDGVRRYRDFRELLDQKDIDAVVIATPDHWHAVQTIMAFRAGKDAFVEKPLTATVYEGRRMVEVEAETGRIGAVCLNRRGSSIYRELAERVPAGVIGKVVSSYASHSSNMYPRGIGKAKPESPPAGFDWDMWLGPREERPYESTIAPYHFRWRSDFSSQMGNWGVHYMDVIRWLSGERAPSSVVAVGGRYAVDDDRDIPDTLTVLFEFESGRTVQFQVNEASGGYNIPGGEVELRGTKGTLIADQNGYSITPARPGQFQDWEKLVEPEEKKLGGDKAYGDLGIKENSSAILIDNFLDCVRDRSVKPYCSLEDAHRSTSFAHLANISLAVGERLRWDADAERFTNNEQANEMLHYEYRAPWSLE
ncbi:MAG: Gfo/Idh/MocA family protein [Spirochaetales bacterium]